MSSSGISPLLATPCTDRSLESRNISRALAGHLGWDCRSELEPEARCSDQPWKPSAMRAARAVDCVETVIGCIYFRAKGIPRINMLTMKYKKVFKLPPKTLAHAFGRACAQTAARTHRRCARTDTSTDPTEGAFKCRVGSLTRRLAALARLVRSLNATSKHNTRAKSA